MCATVLIVDDHAGFRAGARRMLEAGGWDVIGEAADGAAGVDAARQMAPDVVLLDLNLPDASGLELVADLPRGSAVVLTSTHEEEELDESVWYMFFATIDRGAPAGPRQPPLVVAFADGDSRADAFKSIAARFGAAMNEVLERQ